MNLVAVAWLIAASSLNAQTLRRIEIPAPEPERLAAELRQQGLEVLEGGTHDAAVELVVSVAELRALERRYPVKVLEVGRPLREEAVPAGYLDLAQILAELSLAEQDFPGLCRKVNLTATYGTPPTFEGRDLYAVKVSDHVAQDEDEPAVLIVAAHHSREINTPVVALEALARLTAGYGVDPTATALVDSHEIWIAPVWNPDGYEYVFAVDNLWRKNRRVVAGGVGVDLNRNYPFGWSSPCGGSTTPTSETYRGPAAASEPETQTMMAFAQDRHFARVLDFHSSGRETLYGYLCHSHPFTSFLQGEAVALSQAAGYGASVRAPSAEGEHYEWQLATFGNHAFLMEIGTQFQPPFASAQAEAAQLWNSIVTLLERPISVSGHVRDACTARPLAADVTLPGVLFPNGETNTAGGPFGRYALFLPAGSHTVQFQQNGFGSQSQGFTVSAGSAAVHDVDLAASTVCSVPGPARVGTVLSIQFDSPADAGNLYLAGMSLSGTTPGIPLNGCTFPLNLDLVLFLSITGHPLFSQFTGVLDGSGHATGTLTIPAAPDLVGIPADFAFVTIENGSLEFLHPSNPASITFVP